MLYERLVVSLVVMMTIPPLISDGAFPAVLMDSHEFAGEATQSDPYLMKIYNACQYQFANYTQPENKFQIIIMMMMMITY